MASINHTKIEKILTVLRANNDPLYIIGSTRRLLTHFINLLKTEGCDGFVDQLRVALQILEQNYKKIDPGHMPHRDTFRVVDVLLKLVQEHNVMTDVASCIIDTARSIFTNIPIVELQEMHKFFVEIFSNKLSQLYQQRANGIVMMNCLKMLFEYSCKFPPAARDEVLACISKSLAKNDDDELLALSKWEKQFVEQSSRNFANSMPGAQFYVLAVSRITGGGWNLKPSTGSTMYVEFNKVALTYSFGALEENMERMRVVAVSFADIRKYEIINDDEGPRVEVQLQEAAMRFDVLYAEDLAGFRQFLSSIIGDREVNAATCLEKVITHICFTKSSFINREYEPDAAEQSSAIPDNDSVLESGPGNSHAQEQDHNVTTHEKGATYTGAGNGHSKDGNDCARPLFGQYDTNHITDEDSPPPSSSGPKPRSKSAKNARPSDPEKGADIGHTKDVNGCTRPFFDQYDTNHIRDEDSLPPSSSGPKPRSKSVKNARPSDQEKGTGIGQTKDNNGCARPLFDQYDTNHIRDEDSLPPSSSGPKPRSRSAKNARPSDQEKGAGIGQTKDNNGCARPLFDQYDTNHIRDEDSLPPSSSGPKPRSKSAKNARPSDPEKGAGNGHSKDVNGCTRPFYDQYDTKHIHDEDSIAKLQSRSAKHTPLSKKKAIKENQRLPSLVKSIVQHRAQKSSGSADRKARNNSGESRLSSSDVDEFENYDVGSDDSWQPEQRKAPLMSSTIRSRVASRRPLTRVSSAKVTTIQQGKGRRKSVISFEKVTCEKDSAANTDSVNSDSMEMYEMLQQIQNNRIFHSNSESSASISRKRKSPCSDTANDPGTFNHPSASDGGMWGNKRPVLSPRMMKDVVPSESLHGEMNLMPLATSSHTNMQQQSHTDMSVDQRSSKLQYVLDHIAIPSIEELNDTQERNLIIAENYIQPILNVREKLLDAMQQKKMLFMEQVQAATQTFAELRELSLEFKRSHPSDSELDQRIKEAAENDHKLTERIKNESGRIEKLVTEAVACDWNCVKQAYAKQVQHVLFSSNV